MILIFSCFFLLEKAKDNEIKNIRKNTSTFIFLVMLVLFFEEILLFYFLFEIFHQSIFPLALAEVNFTYLI